jgi:hypothetical protein
MLIPPAAIPAFTILHIAISLLAIASGFVVLPGLIRNLSLPRWTAFFLATTVATSVTGFGFPIHGMTPGIALGIISLVILPVVIYSRYSRLLTGRWRVVYIVGSVFALYLNFFVLIFQSFQKITLLRALAPTQSEPPFAAVQVLSLLSFVVLGVLAARRFHPA